MTKKIVLGFSTLFILLELLLISYISYIDFIDLQIITANSLISDKSTTVFFKEDHVPTIFELINSNPDITLVSELYNYPDLRVWGLCGSCYLDNKINSMIKGSFFKKDDFFKKDFKAVVGKNILNSNNCFKDKNGKIYFKFYKNNYEVIGSISSNISNMLDNMAFVNLDSLKVKFRKFIIDGANNKSIVTAINNIQKEYDVDIIREKNSNFMERYIFNDVDKNILNTLVIIFISILIVALSMSILHFYREEINVKRIIGISFRRILFNLFEDIIFLTVINTALVITIYSIIYYIFLKNIHLGFYFLSLIIFSLIMLIAISLIIYVYMLISNKFFYKNGVK